MIPDYEYEDGLDDDGYVIKSSRKPFIRGSEADVGDFKIISLDMATQSALERIKHVIGLDRYCDSPIEYNLGAAVLMFFERAGRPLKLCKTLNLDAASGLVLVPQFAWSYYRSDWAIINAERSTALLIECDGKDFHSSREQRAHDAKKDASAHDRGWLTMRFTGRQIHRDADSCAQKIYDAVMGSK